VIRTYHADLGVLLLEKQLVLTRTGVGAVRRQSPNPFCFHHGNLPVVGPLLLPGNDGLGALICCCACLEKRAAVKYFTQYKPVPGMPIEMCR